MNILCEVDKICKKHNLKYFLVYGSLLGAVRHNGFIPWDDDLDIAMLRDDYEKFLKIAKQELISPYTLCESRYEYRYTNVFAKIFKTDTKYSSKILAKKLSQKGLWVDIFPIDYIKAKDKTVAAKKAAKRMRVVMFFRLLLENRTTIDNSLSKKTKIICKLAKFLPHILFLFIINKIFTINSPKKSNFCVNYGSNYKKEIFSKSYFLQPVATVFENKHFFIPNNPEIILTKMYGNYLEYPPIEQRIPSHDLILNEED